MRKGYGLGKGQGYKNLMPMDSYIHSLSAKGIKSYTKSEQTRLKNLLHSQRNAIITKSAMKQPHKDIVQVLEEVDDARRTIEFGLGAKGKKYAVYDEQTNRYMETGRNVPLNQSIEEIWDYWEGGADLSQEDYDEMQKWSLKQKKEWLEGTGFRFDEVDKDLKEELDNIDEDSFYAKGKEMKQITKYYNKTIKEILEEYDEIQKSGLSINDSKEFIEKKYNIKLEDLKFVK